MTEIKAINAESADLKIMKIVSEFEYLINMNQTMDIKDLGKRAYEVPACMDEPDIQALPYLVKECTIKSIHRNSTGLWFQF
jgi:hypothetical protein